MGIMSRHIQADRKTKRLSYRRAFRAGLRPHVPEQAEELNISLGSTSLKDPTAARRYALANATSDRGLMDELGLAEGRETLSSRNYHSSRV